MYLGHKKVVAVAMAAGLIVPEAAFAQAASNGTSPAPTEALETVVVTAQKRSEDAQKAATTISVVSNDRLITQGISDTRALEAMVPSSSFGDTAGATKVFLRGVGQFIDSISLDPAVSVYTDQVYTPRYAVEGPLFDIDHVEALPGPQGTLYGRNSAGGAYNIVTKKPTDQFGGDASVEFGSYSLVDVTAAMNVPLADDLDARVAMNSIRHDGYLTNGSNDQDSFAVRGSLLYTPTADLSILGVASYWHDGGLGTSGINSPFIKPGNPWYEPPQFTQAALGLFRDNNSVAGHVEVNYKLDADVSLTYIPSYVDVTATDRRLTATGMADEADHQRQVTNELRLSGDTPDLNWIAGVYGYQAWSSQSLVLHIPWFNPTFTSLTGPVFVHQNSAAAYGQATYSVLDWLRLTGGARVSWDQIGERGSNQTVPAPPVPFIGRHDWTNFDWKLGAAADITQENMVYLNVQTGYNSGGLSTVPSATIQAPIVQPERLLAFSLGTKNRFFDDRLEINDEFYYYIYKNYQVTSYNSATGQTQFFNADKALVYGNDLSILLNVTDVDQLSLNLGLLSARAQDFVLLPPAGGGPAPNYDGFQLVYAPEATVNASFEHTWEFSGGSTLKGLVATYFNSGYWGTFNHAIDTRQSWFTKTDLSLTYTTADDKWMVGLWVRNIENSPTYSVLTAGGNPGPSGGQIDAPRTFGARIGTNF
ncbi:MAG: TonB-dependent receptor [Rhizomicrobium sp.]